ncbi:ATP-binding protein [Mycolicibacterium holsaticum]|uniref:ATP-binding protein n=1 Tax=Mycolicibacterium holsaticum TaxID=152142 RepID=UPI001C7CE749|nr:adenylate/guanylate cyclase domain-containing protein [Mycolicibacterium holsaticum]MDA4106307.1 cyclase [Mycolicibacterium holsaticum DSM 44478 = JCM 12374]QZA13381.1 AAA family ATPase [Mycolicibacterium holsaticum DSM 44478 = JCM 12374]UNC09151.1 AAA family ATPase [Mycolicibacterium holsaticum DSM 44478 = JCM 12374]
MAPTTQVCRSCGAAPHAGARFCHRCGSQVATSTDPAEYKQVTVLFADVVRSMGIAAVLDLERLREVMTDLVERSATVVHHYGGSVEYTGDGVMAMFGAPIALEDHAFRACVAALAIQEEASRLAAEVHARDGVALQLRVGLNSGRVIAGEIGSGSLGYAATGESVGFAQRMESVAPPGAVLLSESTARLVEHLVVLAEPEFVHIKGTDEPVRARRLLEISVRAGPVGRAEVGFVGRRWELAVLDALLGCTVDGRGGVVNVVGPAGIGKSRVARETVARAASRGVRVFWTFCESHASDIPFYAVARLLRESTGVTGLDDEAARRQLRIRLPGADPQDLLLLDDLLGIADREVPLPSIDPDARRRRLTALINTASLTDTEPTLYIIEDAHWMDAVSESMLADFLSVIARTSSMVLITARPEYRGTLTQVPGAQTIALAPLTDSDTAVLLEELLGSDVSVSELATIITERAAGNPFFAEEMVRELIQRGALTPGRDGYVCGADIGELTVPATVQAAIEARIDRLSVPAKQTLYAASVIGTRFEQRLVAALGVDALFDELLGAELIDQVRFTADAEFAFRHPLIRTVAYESQLKSDRAEWHRRLATAIQESEPDSVEDNAALIAEHLQAAGDLRTAYGWHMRAATSSATRDVSAARVSWERARRIADALPDDGPEGFSMRIAPRTMLCATDWAAPAVEESQGRFAEMCELCSAAGDKVSLAIAMTGRAGELLYAGRPGEGSQLASEQMALLESIGDPTLTIGLSFVAFVNWFNVGRFAEILRWSQTIIDLAAGDAAKGAGFGMGSPLAIAVAFRGLSRWWLGRPGWRQDLNDALAMGRNSDPTTFGFVVAWTYGLAIPYGVLRADDSTKRTVEETVQIADAAGNDGALSGAQFNLGAVLLYRDAEADRRRGLAMMTHAHDVLMPQRVPSLVPVAKVLTARERARRGDRDAAIPVMRQAADELHRAGRFGWDVLGSGLLVETLLERSSERDLTEAKETIDRLTNAQADQRWAILEITLLRLRTLLARKLGDHDAYRDLASRYRATAESLGYEGHIAMARAT